MTEKPVELGERKVLQTLELAEQLTRAQLTMGPLRHFSQQSRNRILRRLVRQKFLEESEVHQPAGGPVGRRYRITEAGRAALKQRLGSCNPES